jgi:di/tricarboxylate transporter
MIYCILGRFEQLSSIDSRNAALGIYKKIKIRDGFSTLLHFSTPYGLAAPLMVAISCSCALLLPVSTPSNAVAYATGMIEQKEFRLPGIFFLIIGPFAAFISSMIWIYLRH